ncbi:MAG: nicotinate-nicotinamide nucleotide adenylyltransferase, partial [Phycisphaerales bacterium]
MPAHVRTLLVFGGAFDPPHRAHIELPALVRKRIGADWVLYVPTGRSPLKERGQVAGFDDRVAMLCAAIDPGFASVSTIEGERAGRTGVSAPSYTVDTLQELREALPPSVRMRFLFGADQAAQFHKWRSAAEVSDLAPPVVMLRTPHETRAALLDAMR